MRSAIAIIMAVLGTVLILSGAAGLWAAALVRPRGAGPEPVGPISRMGRGLNAVSQLPGPDRLIVWGVLLLGLSAVAAGAIQFSATATAGVR
jgi:hypothetical protein